MRRLTIFILCSFFLTTALTTQAQETQEIEYGEIVIFEISTRNNEIPFQFTGNANDVIVAHLMPTERRNIADGILRLFNSAGELLGDTSDSLTPSDVTLALVLPTDDTYTLVATIYEGVSGGEQKLYLTQPIELTAGQVFSTAISTATQNNYYLIRQTEEPTFFTYRILEGDAWPAIKISEIRESQLGGLIRLSAVTITEIQVALPQNVDPIIVEVGGVVTIWGTAGRTTAYEVKIS